MAFFKSPKVLTPTTAAFMEGIVLCYSEAATPNKHRNKCRLLVLVSTTCLRSICYRLARFNLVTYHDLVKETKTINHYKMPFYTMLKL